jgi:hypothetical protein
VRECPGCKERVGRFYCRSPDLQLVVLEGCDRTLRLSFLLELMGVFRGYLDQIGTVKQL